MKKIINRPENVVLEMCSGIAMANPDVQFLPRYKIIRKKKIDQKKVSLISGGGSGHEPAHAGFVGKGLLDAAVCGDVFASPSQIQVYKAIRETASEKGTLLIIKNYSGDVMNFKNAAALTADKADVDYVIVNDDIAVQDSLYTVGRRGVAGTVLVHKIAGAAAELGMSLPEVKKAAQHAIDNIRSVGFALTSCTVPAKGSPTFDLSEDEMEYGVGIHGEPGIGRQKVRTADELAGRMVKALVSDLKVKKGGEVTLLINGFGGSPLQELYLFCNCVCRELANRGIEIYRTFVGNFMTSLDMQGASVTIMKMDAELKKLLCVPCDAPGLHIAGASQKVVYQDLSGKEEAAEADYGNRIAAECAAVREQRLNEDNIRFLIDRMGTFIIEQEVPFCELDSHAGDGDFGMSVAKGFRELKRSWNTVLEEGRAGIGEFLEACALVIMEHCGGASGPIWGSAFYAAGRSFMGVRELSVKDMNLLLQSAVKGIQETGERSFGRGATVGDKTLIDALIPCSDAWKECAATGASMEEAFEAGAKAAVLGAKKTEQIIARMGRAGAVGERSLGYPDAGAYALGQIFTHLAGELRYIV